MPNEISSILRKARDLISVPERWTQGFDARDAHGNHCFSSTEDAVCWCSIGAIKKFSPSGQYPKVRSLLYVVMGCHPADFNDTSTHDEVLAAFDTAIEMAEQQ